MTPIPNFYLEITPFIFSLFLNAASFFQDNVTEQLLRREINLYHPTLDRGAISNIVNFMLDMGQRLTFFVTVLTSMIAAAVLGFQKNLYGFLFGSLVLAVVSLYLSVLFLWKMPLGRLVQGSHWYIKPATWLTAIMMVINAGFITVLWLVSNCPASALSTKP